MLNIFLIRRNRRVKIQKKLVKDQQKNKLWHIQDELTKCSPKIPVSIKSVVEDIPALKTYCGNKFTFHGWRVYRPSDIPFSEKYKSYEMKEKDLKRNNLKRNGHIKGEICEKCKESLAKEILD